MRLFICMKKEKQLYSWFSNFTNLGCWISISTIVLLSSQGCMIVTIAQDILSSFSHELSFYQEVDIFHRSLSKLPIKYIRYIG